MDVFGLVDGTEKGSMREVDWPETGVAYNTMPGFSGDDYPNIDLDHVFGEIVYLGSISYVAGTTGEIQMESTSALVDFINADTNGFVTFILEAPVADTSGDDLEVVIRSNRGAISGEQLYPTLVLGDDSTSTAEKSSLFVSFLARDQRLLIAGDSTVNNVDPRTGWGQMIGNYLKPGITVVNEAVPGKSSKTFILEGLWSGLLEKTRSGDVIFVQFGHNDSHAPDRYESTDAETDYKDYLRTYADDAAAAGASLVFVTPPHRRLFNADGTITQELLPYANAMKAVAQEKGVPAIDLYSLSGSDMQELGEEGSLPLFCSAEDRTHFSDEGADWLAGLIAGELKCISDLAED